MSIDPNDFAFLYFVITILIIILIPLTINVVKPILRGKDPKYRKAPKCMQKAIELDWRRNAFYRKKSYYFKTFIWVILVMVFVNAYQQLPDPKLMRGFDPYDVLGVSTSSSLQDIKKAYRKLAVTFHPDKYFGDPAKAKEQEERFIMMSKAYECLTDPRKIPNCKKYGSPDGPQAYQIGIAIPFELSGLTLGIIVISFVLLVLILVYRSITDLGKYNRYNILNANNKLLFQYVQSNKLTNYQQCLDLISQCQEVQDKEFLTKQSVEHAPGILYTVIDIAISLLKTSQEQDNHNHKKNKPQQRQKNQLLSPDMYNRQVEVCLNAIPKIIQNQSKYTHPGKPQLEVKLGYENQDGLLKMEDLDIYSIYKLEIKLSGLVDEFISSETFPSLKLNVWNIMFIYKDIIVDFRQVLENKREITIELKFVPASLEQREIASFRYQVIAMADSYPLKLEQDLTLVSKLPVQEIDFKKKRDSDSEQDSD